MAHFALIDENNIVVEVIVAEQEFIDSGAVGDPATWVQTSYNTINGVHYDPKTGELSADQSKALRKQYAGIGFTYDKTLDAFVPPQPHVSWTLDETTCLWGSPEPKPDIQLDENGVPTGAYLWDEDSYTQGNGGWVFYPRTDS